MHHCLLLDSYVFRYTVNTQALGNIVCIRYEYRNAMIVCSIHKIYKNCPLLKISCHVGSQMTSQLCMQYLPLCHHHLQMAYALSSIFHTSHIHNSTHHFVLNTFCRILPTYKNTIKNLIKHADLIFQIYTGHVYK